MRHLIEVQNSNRKLWENHDDQESLERMILEEFGEFYAQLQECYLTDDLTALALEIGDVLYLCERYQGLYDNLPTNLHLLKQQVLEVCSDLELNPNDCIEAKLIRNCQKYPDHIMSNGRPYQEAVRVCKESWKAMGGDVAWSNVWLDLLAHIN